MRQYIRMKQTLEKILYTLARMILKRQKPDVIGITGSVGKTSAKEAIYAVLDTKYSVRRNIRNYNNEIGVPLTIIGSDTGGRNPFKWAWILTKGLLYGAIPLPYPKILVLEMGADHPGDIKYLTTLAPANVGAVTAIGDQPSHLEFFKDVAQLAKEKHIMFTHMSVDDTAIVNLDEPYSRDIMEKIKAKPFTISLKREADLQAVEIQYSRNPQDMAKSPQINGLSFKFHYQGSVVPCFIPNVLGLPQVYASLFAAAAGITYNMNLVEIIEALQQYRPPQGRMNLIAGQHQSLIIDDSYNSSPAAVREALNVFSKIESIGKRIVCLGDMEELGKQSKRAHTLVGKKVAELSIEYLLAIGEKAQGIADAAIANGMDRERVNSFKTVEEAITKVRHLVEADSVVLVKGSQSTRMEKLVEAIMDDPDQAEELLVRQYGHWKTV